MPDHQLRVQRKEAGEPTSEFQQGYRRAVEDFTNRSPSGVGFREYLTAGSLRAMLDSVPDDASVYYQRIEDSYFDEGSWRTVERPGENGWADQYVRAFCVITYKGDNAIYITAHY